MRKLAALLLAALLPARGWGQGWTADLSAGRTKHETIEPSTGTGGLAFGVRYDGQRWLYLEAGAPLDSMGSPWAAAGAGTRIEARRSGFRFGADLGSYAAGYRERILGVTGADLTVEALPFLALSRGAATLELHAGPRAYSGVYGDSSFTHAVLDGGAALRYVTSPRVTLTAESRLVVAPEGGFPYLGAGIELHRNRAAAWASLGQWLSGSIPTPTWTVGGSLDLAGGFTAQLSLQRDSRDPLYWNVPRRYWSVGVSHALNRSPARSAPAAPPAPASAPAVAAGTVAIRLPATEARVAPSVAGDFTGWKPVQMTRSGEYWVAAFPLRPGVYHYAFRRADGSWFVPRSFRERVDDGFGGVSAVLIVR